MFLDFVPYINPHIISIAIIRSINTGSFQAEPCEFRVKRRIDDNIYPMLAAGAVLLLGGRLPEKST